MSDSEPRRTAVVTGGGTGMGREIAKTLAGQGLDVTVTGRREDVLGRTAAGIGARAVAFDAADPAAVEAALPALPDRVDVLVNNAGGNAARTIGATSDGLAGVRESWLAQFEMNVLTAVLVTTALTPRLADDGRVILVGSIAGARGSGGYGAAKAAVHNWGASLAFELGARGITVNTLAPGLTVQTEFFGDSLTDERRSGLVAQTANGREGRPADVASVVAFLASPEAGHITGQVIHVNGGAFLGR